MHKKNNMRTLQITNIISKEKLMAAMKTAKTIADFKRWQIILLTSEYDVDADFLSVSTGYSKANVYAIVQQHNAKDKPDVSIQNRGGRRRSLLSIEEEKEMMQKLEDKALKGQILSFWDIKKIVETQVGKSVSDDFLWDLFKRNGWTKHSPRPHHPKRNEAAQEEFKKNSKTIWMPLKMILSRT